MKKLSKSLMTAFLIATMVLCKFAGTVPTGAAALTTDQYLKKMNNKIQIKDFVDLLDVKKECRYMKE